MGGEPHGAAERAVAPDARGKRAELMAVAAVASVVEAGAAGVSELLGLSVAWLVAVHCGVVAGLVLWLLRLESRGEDVRLPLVLTLATIVAGPIGAVLSLVVLPFAGLRPAKAALLDAWYRRIAEAAAVAEAARVAADVATGRAIDISAPVPRAFADVMESGTLAERQTALGLIARKFHPEYSAALDAALKSPEPVVRVQAAAVAAKVRRELQARVQNLTDEAAGGHAQPGRAAAIAAELAASLGSGLLDENDRIRAAQALRALRPVAAEAGRLAGAVPRDGRESALIEDELLAAGRFAELRDLRRRRRVTEKGRFVVRPARQRLAGNGKVRA